jgi:four helix bundle protein
MRNYKNLVVWEKAHKLTLAVYKNTLLFPSAERFGLTSQIRRAAASIAANLAEGCGRRSGEMARYVQIAMGSGAELSYHLLLSKDLGYLGAAEFGSLISALDEVMKTLSGLSARLKSPVGERVLELRANG